MHSSPFNGIAQKDQVEENSSPFLIFCASSCLWTTHTAKERRHLKDACRSDMRTSSSSVMRRSLYVLPTVNGVTVTHSVNRFSPMYSSSLENDFALEFDTMTASSSPVSSHKIATKRSFHQAIARQEGLDPRRSLVSSSEPCCCVCFDTQPSATVHNLGDDFPLGHPLTRIICLLNSNCPFRNKG